MCEGSYLRQRAQELSRFLYGQEVHVIIFSTTPPGEDLTDATAQTYTACVYPVRETLSSIVAASSKKELFRSMVTFTGWGDSVSVLRVLVSDLEREVGTAMRAVQSDSHSEVSSAPSAADIPAPASPIFQEALEAPRSLHTYLENLPGPPTRSVAPDESTMTEYDGVVTPTMSQSTYLFPDDDRERDRDRKVIVREEVNAAVRGLLASLLEGIPK